MSYFVDEPKKNEKNLQNETVYKNNLNFRPNFAIILASIKTFFQQTFGNM